MTCLAPVLSFTVAFAGFILALSGRMNGRTTPKPCCGRVKTQPMLPIGWPSAAGRRRGRKSRRVPNENPDMKPGPVMPQRTSGHDDHSEDSGIS